MNLRDLLGFTRQAVRFHRLRSAMTAIGIAIGVAAVVLLTSMGEGLNRFMVEQFAQFGTNNLRIGPGKAETLGFSPGVLNTLRPLTIEDAKAVAQLPGVVAVNPGHIAQGEVEANGRFRDATVFGTGPDAPVFLAMDLAAGQFLPDDDWSAPRPLAVIGATLARDLYGGTSALGDRIRVAGSRFTIVGVLEPKGDILGLSVDESVMIPAARSMELFNVNGLMEIGVRYAEDANVDELVASIRRLMLARHGFEDFNIQTQQQMIDTLGAVLDVLTLAVAALGSISLFVGGVGIFTIMTIAINERTGEIGLLRALGSSRSQVGQLFLAESMMLAGLGGLLGLLLGGAIALLLGLAVPSLPVRISVPYVLAAEAVAIGIGLLAGVAPARRAARLDPLVALRAE